jgi:integrase
VGNVVLPSFFENCSMLTDSKLKNAKPDARPYKLVDGQGLHALVQTNGSILWQQRYRFEGKERTASHGSYPLVSLLEARKKRDELKKLLLEGLDPAKVKRQRSADGKFSLGDTFKEIADTWHRQWSEVRSPRHAAYVRRRLEGDVFPVIGDLPIASLRPLDIVKVIKAIESRGAVDIAKRAYQTIGAICRYAVAHGLMDRDPTRDVKPSDILISRRSTNYARVDARELPELLRAVEAYQGTPATRFALKLMALTFVRTGELIAAKWVEFDFDEAIWRIPPERMKMRTEHIVPLSRQAIETLRTLQMVSRDSELLFPGDRNRRRPISNNTLLKALERMGFKGRMTGHGFRGLASTVLHEHGFDHAHIEAQLAHQERNRISASYNHALYLKQRGQMMQWWADYLDQALGRNVLPLKRRAIA